MKISNNVKLGGRSTKSARELRVSTRSARKLGVSTRGKVSLGWRTKNSTVIVDGVEWKNCRSIGRGILELDAE